MTTDLWGTTEELEEFNYATVDIAATFTHATLSSLERLVALNVSTARAVFDDSVSASQALLLVQDVPEFISTSSSQMAPMVDTTSSYSRRIYDMASESLDEFAKTFESHLAKVNKIFASALDKTFKFAGKGVDATVPAAESTEISTTVASSPPAKLLPAPMSETATEATVKVDNEATPFVMREAA